MGMKPEETEMVVLQVFSTSCHITDKYGNTMCELHFAHYIDKNSCLKQAEFIVEACNNYERLQSENEKMRELLDEIQAELFIQIDDGEPIDARKYRTKIQTLLNPK